MLDTKDLSEREREVFTFEEKLLNDSLKLAEMKQKLPLVEVDDHSLVTTSGKINLKMLFGNQRSITFDPQYGLKLWILHFMGGWN
jgi:predicted dithiol-disulfide oxidoreductase (DUF899 family)